MPDTAVAGAGAGGLLARIVASKRAEVRRIGVPPDASPRETTGRPGFAGALRRPRTGLILECKRISPSRGVLRPDYDPVDLARRYAPFADAISVLADGPFFGGSPADVARVRAAVDRPVLFKDIVVDPLQVRLARAHGADAVLLMAAVLDRPAMAECHAEARSLGMDALVEVHDEAQLAMALELGVPLIGINNRDLRTLEVDLSVTERLAPQVPRDVVLVAESGVRDHRDLVRLRPRVDGALVGTAVIQRPDVDHAVRELVFGRVKICGLTNPADAAAAWAAGATYGGVIFAEGSPRQIEPGLAAEVVAAAPLRWVGVFVDERPERIGEIARSLGLAAVQLHGDESGDDVGRVRRAVPGGCQVWKAHAVRGPVPAGAARGADRLLLDTHAEGQRGGTGRSFDWGLLESLDGRDEVVLAGGLRPSNVGDADGVGAWALDVGSGVEAAPGVKDAHRFGRLFEALRGRTGRRSG